MCFVKCLQLSSLSLTYKIYGCINKCGGGALVTLIWQWPWSVCDPLIQPLPGRSSLRILSTHMKHFLHCNLKGKKQDNVIKNLEIMAVHNPGVLCVICYEFCCKLLKCMGILLIYIHQGQTLGTCHRYK